MSRNLLEIGDDLRALNDLLDETGGELATPEVEAAFASLSHALVGEESAKLDSCVNYLRRLDMEATAARAEAEQYMTHATVREARAKRFKDFLRSYIETTGRTKVQTESGRVLAVQANGGQTPVRFLDPALDPNTVPVEWVVVRKTVNVDAVRRALEEGNPDAKRIAVLESRGRHLRIR